MGTTSVEPAALRCAAQSIDIAADSVLGALNTPLRFDSAVSGRAHSAAGSAVRSAVERVVDDARQWVFAVREAADALRLGADRHAATDIDAATVLQ